MPDGFDNLDGDFFGNEPRVMNLREFTTECRKMAPRVLRMMSELLDNRDQLTAVEQMALSVLISDRAYGRPRQQLASIGSQLDGVDGAGGARRVRVYLPDNGRNNRSPPQIDADQTFKESE